MLKRIFVYSDKGTSATNVKYTVKWLQKYTYLEVTPILHSELNLLDFCELLVIPGGRDLPYCELLGNQSDKILGYMYNGGKYLGVCAGSYFASSFVEFELDTPYQVIGKRPLRFFNGTAKGTIYPKFQYHSESGAHVVPLSGKLNTSCYYNGGPMFIPNDDKYAPIMRYANGELAILKTKVGNGTAVLSGVHLEYDSHEKDHLNLELSRTSDSRNQLSQHILYDIFNLPRHPTEIKDETIYTFGKELEISGTVLASHNIFTINSRTFDFASLLEGDKFDFIFAPVIPTTQAFLMKCSLKRTTICLALNQTHGLGRSNNTWVSFSGGLFVTMFTEIKLNPSKLSVIQLLVADAICKAIHQQQDAFKSRIKIKWPNDIIDIISKSKMGGILINSELHDTKVKLYIGFGINVENTEPSGCLADIAKIDMLVLLKDIIDNIMICLKRHEESTQLFDDGLKEDYKRNWAHGSQTIKYQNEQITIFDVTDQGNLLARSDRSVFEVSSDGNRFDFFNNMIVRKQ